MKPGRSPPCPSLVMAGLYGTRTLRFRVGTKNAVNVSDEPSRIEMLVSGNKWWNCVNNRWQRTERTRETFHVSYRASVSGSFYDSFLCLCKDPDELRFTSAYKTVFTGSDCSTVSNVSFGGDFVISSRLIWQVEFAENWGQFFTYTVGKFSSKQQNELIPKSNFHEGKSLLVETVCLDGVKI